MVTAWQARHDGGSTMIALRAMCLLPSARFELVLLPQTEKSRPLNSKFESGLLPHFRVLTFVSMSMSICTVCTVGLAHDFVTLWAAL